MAGELAKLLPYRSSVPIAPPRARLLCLPFAGGSAASYRTWSDALGDAVDVCAIELPGHGQRVCEKPIADVSLLADHLATELAPLFDGTPVICFGHSLGARIGFWLARQGGVAGLIASASLAPHIAAARLRSELPHGALVAELRAMGGTPAAVLASPELMDMFLPGIRADFRMHEHAHVPVDVRVSCPVTVIAARDDVLVSYENATGWQHATTAECETFELTGGHFFLAARQPQVLSIVRTVIARWT